MVEWQNKGGMGGRGGGRGGRAGDRWNDRPTFVAQNDNLQPGHSKQVQLEAIKLKVWRSSFYPRTNTEGRTRALKKD